MTLVFSFHCGDSTSQVETDDPKHPSLVVIIIFHILMNEDCIKFSRLDLNNHLVNTNSQITGSRGLCNKINCLSTWAGYIYYNSDANVSVWSPSEHYRSFICLLCYLKMNQKNMIFYIIFKCSVDWFTKLESG